MTEADTHLRETKEVFEKTKLYFMYDNPQVCVQIFCLQNSDCLLWFNIYICMSYIYVISSVLHKISSKSGLCFSTIVNTIGSWLTERFQKTGLNSSSNTKVKW